MAKSKKSERDSANAQRLKKLGVKRTVCRCVICHKVVPLKGYPNHLRTCGRGDS